MPWDLTIVCLGCSSTLSGLEHCLMVRSSWPSPIIYRLSCKSYRFLDVGLLCSVYYMDHYGPRRSFLGCASKQPHVHVSNLVYPFGRQLWPNSLSSIVRCPYLRNWDREKDPCIMDVLNPLPTIGNSLNKQKSLYKVVTPSIKPPYKLLWAYGSSWRIYWLVNSGCLLGVPLYSSKTVLCSSSQWCGMHR